jgi:hypothetical protein
MANQMRKNFNTNTSAKGRLAKKKFLVK